MNTWCSKCVLVLAVLLATAASAVVPSPAVCQNADPFAPDCSDCN